MSTILGLFEGGTTGLRDGTLISSGDTETNPFPFTSLDTVHTLHYRAIDSVTGDDPAEDSSGNIVFTCPGSVGASFTIGGSYVTTPTADATAVHGGNQPIYLKQTALVESSAVNLTVDALNWKTGTRVGQVGTLTPTASNQQVSLNWSDVASADGYEIDYLAHPDEPTSGEWLTATRTTSVSSDKVVSGLVNGTVYQFRARAYDERGVGLFSATASATPNAVATDVGGWGAAVGGGGPITGGATGVGRTFIDENNAINTAGTITRVDIYWADGTAESLSFKIKVFRLSAGNYTYVGQSESINIQNEGTGYHSYTLSTPISGVQVGDLCSIFEQKYSADGFGIDAKAAQPSHTYYITGDITTTTAKASFSDLGAYALTFDFYMMI